MKWFMTVFKLLLSSKLTALIGLAGVIVGAASNPEFATLIPENWAAIAVTLGGFLTTLSRGLVDTNGNGIPDVLEFLTGTPAAKAAAERRAGFALPRLLGMIVLLGVLSTVACAATWGGKERVAARPHGGITAAIADGNIRLSIPCDGPVGMNCSTTVRDSSTAPATVLANSVAHPRSTVRTVDRPFPYGPAGSVTFGIERVGVTAGLNNSEPKLDRIVVTWQAGTSAQPSGTITFVVTPATP